MWFSSSFPVSVVGMVKLVNHRACDRQVASSSRQVRWENCSFPELTSMLTFIRCLFDLRVAAAVCKRFRSFCQKCRWQVYACIRILPWPCVFGSGRDSLCCPGIVWKPIREMSLHATRQGTLGDSCLNSLSHCGPGLKNGNGVHNLISFTQAHTHNT